MSIVQRLNQRGQSLVEIIVALAIFSLVALATSILFLDSITSLRVSNELSEATALVYEGIDASRSIRDNSWLDLATGTHGLDDTSGSWAFSGSPETVGDYTRTVTVEDVDRDGSFNIAGSGTNDPRTKLVTVDVSWNSRGSTQSTSVEAYLTDWNVFDWVEDLTAEFSLGSFSSTETQTSGDGEVILETTGGADFSCVVEIVAFDADGTQNANAVAYDSSGDTAYIVRQSGGGDELVIMDVSTPASPSLLGSLDLGANASKIEVVGDYAYVATYSDTQELMVIDVSIPASLAIDAAYDASGSANGLALDVSGDRAYLGRNSSGDDEFFIINISTPTSPSLVSSFDVGSNVDSIAIDGTEAYITAAAAAEELTSLDISNENSVSLLDTLDLTGGQDGYAVIIDSSNNDAYVARANNGSGDEVFSVDISTPSSLVLQDSIDVGANANGLHLNGEQLLVATDNTDAELAILDVSDPTDLSQLFTVNLDNNANGIAASVTHLFVASDDSGGEMVILESSSGWACPAQDGVYDAAGSEDVLDLFVVDDVAYQVHSNGSNTELFVLDVSTVSTPSLLGSLELGDTASSVYVSGNYAYIATSSATQEVMIVDVSSPGSMAIDASFDLAGGADAQAIWVNDDRAYVGRVSSGDPDFYVLDVTDPLGPAEIDSIDIANNVTGVFTVGDYAYLSTTDNAGEVVSVDMTTETSLSIADTLDLAENEDANDIHGEGSYVYVVRASGNDTEFNVIDISTPTALSDVAGLDLPDGVNGLWTNAGLALVATDTDKRELAIVDISTPTSPTLLGGYDTDSDLTSVYMDGIYAYLGSESNDNEFEIISIDGTPSSTSIITDTEGEFDDGTYADTQYSTDHIELDATGLTNGTGTYTSDVFSAGTVTGRWESVSWTPAAPYGKQLPDNESIETAYDEGNADMTDNELLLHLNEGMGTLRDTSGNGNDGTQTGGITYGTAGKLDTAVTLDGLTNLITVSDDATLDITDDITIEGWMQNTAAGLTIGDIADTALDTFEYDPTLAQEPSMVQVSGDIYAIAYSGQDSDGFVVTVDIDSAGAITGSVIDTLEFETTVGQTPDLIHVSGDIYAIAYRGQGSDGFVVTVDIDSAGTIAASVVDSWEYDTVRGYTPDIINISGDIYAIAYSGQGSDGFVVTVDIDSAGTITTSAVDSLEFDTTRGASPRIVNVSGDIYAIAYSGQDSDGFVVTVDIDSAGTIANSVVDSFEYDTLQGNEPFIEPVSGDIFAIAYSGDGADGYLATVDIDSAGTIAGAVVDSYEFDTTNGNEPDIEHVGGDVYAIAYRGEGSDGYLITVDVDSAGTITTLPIDTLEFDATVGNTPDIVQISGDTFAIAYRGVGSDGFVVTIGIQSSTGVTPAGIVKSGAYALTVDSTTVYGMINGTTISSATLPSGLNHVALTYDRDLGSDQMKLYVNGLEATAGTLTEAVTTNANDVVIGENLAGSMDELAIYSQVLSATELLDHYKRGILDVQFQIRSCDDASCSGETFLGLDHHASEYYEEIDNHTVGLPNFDISYLSSLQYFQYQITLTTEDTSYTPELQDATVDYTSFVPASGGGGSGYPSSGTFTSQVFDSDSTASAWQTLYWSESLPAGTDATIAVRSGNTATPDGSWSAFSSEYTDAEGTDLSSQSGRYFQYRATLTTTDTNATPELEDITITYK